MDTSGGSKERKSDLPKIPPVVWDSAKLQVFERKHEMEIRSLSPGLEIGEILSYYGIDSVDSLPEYDRWFLETAHSRGRIIAKQNAVASIIKSMESRDALAASLAYLTRFGNDSWQSDSGIGSKIPKSIRIVMEE